MEVKYVLVKTVDGEDRFVDIPDRVINGDILPSGCLEITQCSYIRGENMPHYGVNKVLKTYAQGYWKTFEKIKREVTDAEMRALYPLRGDSTQDGGSSEDG